MSNTPSTAGFDVAEIRRRLAAEGHRRLWSSLEEIADDEQFQAWLAAEFPAAADIISTTDRRTFFKLMGASLALAGLTGCSEGRSDLARPYVDQPEGMSPGVPSFYATAVCLAGYAQPVLATCHDGRPTKLDGNPQHPATVGGGSDVFTQAAILQLYDPDRSKAPVRNGVESTWSAFERELADWRREWAAKQGAGLRILSGHLTSPTLLRLLHELRSALPQARWHIFEPAGVIRREEAMQLAFGRRLDVHYRLENCETIVSLDEDLLGAGPLQIIHARGWAKRRGETAPGQGRARLHVAESVPTLTGTVASTRLPADPSRLAVIAVALGRRLGASIEQPAELARPESEWVDRAARELSANPGRSLLACGAHLDPTLQALAAWLNERLGNAGRTVTYTEPVTYRDDGSGGLNDLVHDMAAGSVDTLIVLDSNPVYTAPGAIGLANYLAKIRRRIHVGLYRDETAVACGWHLPLAHDLESWSDARAADGTSTLIQPVVHPLYSTRSMPEIAAMLGGSSRPDGKELLRKTWSDKLQGAFDKRWPQSLQDGFIGEPAGQPLTLTAKQPDTSKLTGAGGGAAEIVFRPDPCVWDGRFSNVAWLQELPKPLTKITWDCPVAVSPHIAESHGLANGDLVEVSVSGRSIVGPAWVVPGQAPKTVGLTFGYGRQRGDIPKDIGYSAYEIAPADGSWTASGSIRKKASTRQLATTQLHHRMEGFDLVREVSEKQPKLPPLKPQPSLYPEWQGTDYAWGMVIDLDLCIGCNACITACNIENNVPVVGREQVAMGREMLWLRVDRYYTGPLDNPRSYFQPVPCMHCEKAPCEMGCPVHATVHSPEGVNQMVYNRCIGTRTCSSYCPYKVRRFNWFDYRHFDAPSEAAHNPDVTVRSRGVMEKCTYCVQRVEAAHAAADKEGRQIRRDEVVTACQQACPTSAITFGNIKDPESSVAKLRQSGRHYALLEQLGTRPRTTYLARWNDEPDKDRNGS